MLVGIFKDPSRCKCSIIKYVDRIWLSETGDARILRTFIVKVDENSPVPLKEIRMLLPVKQILDLENFYEACFLPPSENYFNSPEACTTEESQVIQEPPKPPKFDSFGIIRHDVSEDIKVFSRMNQSSFQIGECSVIRFQLPRPLQKGKSTEIRIKFQVTSLFDKPSLGPFPNYSIEFSYFSQKYIEEIKQLNRKLEIKIKPILGLEKSRFRGGFDIFLYFPPEFEEVSGFNDYFKEKYDTHNLYGKEEPTKRHKYLWRLRDLLKKRRLSETKLTGIGEEIIISGTLAKRYNEKAILDILSQKIPKGFEIISAKIRGATWISYIAVALAIISILLYLFIKR